MKTKHDRSPWRRVAEKRIGARRAQRHCTNRRRPGFEVLESRLLLAVTHNGCVGGTLEVVADADGDGVEIRSFFLPGDPGNPNGGGETFVIRANYGEPITVLKPDRQPCTSQDASIVLMRGDTDDDGNRLVSFLDSRFRVRIYGGGGNDHLFAQGGGRLFGESGDDVLSDSAYDDYLSGGLDSDTFYFTELSGIDVVVEEPSDGIDLLSFAGIEPDITFSISEFDDLHVLSMSGYELAVAAQRIERLHGGDGNDTLIARQDTINTFEIRSGNNSGIYQRGNVQDLRFSYIENLIGGNRADLFRFHEGMLSGFLDGGAGIDTLEADNQQNSWVIDRADSGTVTALSGRFHHIERLHGGADRDSFQFTAGGTLAGTLEGGAGFDRIIGDDLPSRWTVWDVDTGSYAQISGLFRGVEDLIGGNHNDDFFIGPGTLSGFIDGNGGIDRIFADHVPNVWNIHGTGTGTVTGVDGGFANIEDLMGGDALDSFVLAGGTVDVINGGAGNDSLQADDVVNTWALIGNETGTVTGLGIGFVSVENIAGGSAADFFTFSGGTLSGSLDGGGGIDQMIGDSSRGNVWNITQPDGGTFTSILGTFRSVEFLSGAAQTDHFAIQPAGSLTGRIDGAGGPFDSIDYSAWNSPSAIDLGSGTATNVAGGVQGIETVYGGNANDTIFGNMNNNLIDGGSGDDVLSGGSGNDTLLGGLGDDTIVDSLGTNLLDGQSGCDTVNGSTAGDPDCPLLEPVTVVDVCVSGTTWAMPCYSLLTGEDSEKPLPWFGLNHIAVKFSQAVEVALASLIVTGVNVPRYVPTGFSYNASTHTATYTFARPFRADKLLVNIDGEERDASPVSSAGPGGTLLTGNRGVGSDFERRVDVLPGDANRNGSVTAADIVDIVLAVMGRRERTIFQDMEGDGDVDFLDVVLAASRSRTRLPAGEPLDVQ